MPNHVEVKAPARRALDRAGVEGREELLQCLEYIRENPEPDGRLIIAALKAPVVVYVYDDGTHVVEYYLSQSPATGDFLIEVIAIA